MKKLVQLILAFSSFAGVASDVQDYCTNVDQDVALNSDNLNATYYENSQAKIFHFDSEDYTLIKVKKVVLEESKIEGVKDTHFALSIIVNFNKQIEVPANTEFNSVFKAAKDASSAKVHLICRDYSVGSPVPPAQ